MLELECRIPVAAGIRLLVVGAVEEGEGEVVLVLAHLHHRGIRQRQGGIALVGSVVIHHHPVHHSLVVLGFGAQHITVDAVVEGSCRDFYLVFGAAYIIPEGINLVPGDRHQVIANVECSDTDYDGCQHQRQHHAGKRNAGALDGHKLVMVPHLPQHHHRCQQGGQRKSQRHDGASAQQHEFQHDAQTKALTHEFVDIHP